MPAEPLAKALLQFGTQAHVQIMYAWDSSTANIQTNALKGKRSVKDALTELLRGTRLRFVANSRTVEILPEIPSRAVEPASSAGESNRRPVGASKGPRDTNEEDDDPPAKSSTPAGERLNEVIVTGSRLASTSQDGPQEVQIYDRAKIEQSGQTSISDFLATLPSVSVMSPTTALGVATTVTLRGLPIGTTLVLLDGRRIEDSSLAYLVGGGEYFDLDNVPLAAVQKIEVDELGSSAVYGSDAISGVVNIILKRDFNGFEMSAKYASAADTTVVRANVAWGREWQRGGLSIIASDDVDGGLLNTDRALTANNDYRAFGGPDSNYPVCSPGNVFSVNGAPLPGAPAGTGATYAAVTGLTASGKPPLSQFTYGALNQCSFIAGESLRPSTHRAGILAQGHFELATNVELFSELMYSHVRQIDRGGYQSLFGTAAFQEYTVAATNPYNPFGIKVGVAESLHNVPTLEDYDTDFFRPLIGLRGRLPHRWHWEVSTWQSVDWTQSLLPNYMPNSAAIQSALNSTDPSTALNPFVNGPAAPESVLESLFANGNVKSMGRDRSAEAFIRGPALRLPAGDVQVVLGGDYVQSTLGINDISGVAHPNTRYNFTRKYYAGFGEVRVPLIAGHNLDGAADLLSVTASGRHDQYSDFGGATTDQFGFDLRPIDSLLIRGTYGDAFKAPSLPSLNNPQMAARALVKDPATRGSALVQFITGGNPGLRPLTGLSRSIGVVYSSHAVPGLLLSVTQWHVTEADSVQTLTAQVIVNNANDFPGRIIRNSAGSITEVIGTAVNFGSLDVAGIDYEFEYSHPIMRGEFSINADASDTYHYRQALVPGTSPIEVTSKAQDDGDWAPRVKGSVGVGWAQQSITAHLDGRYTSSYQDYNSTRHIGNFWVFDGNVRWRFGESHDGSRAWFGAAYAEIGAVNLFNRAPQFSNYFSDLYGYDAAQMSIVGRTLYAQLGSRW